MIFLKKSVIRITKRMADAQPSGSTDSVNEIHDLTIANDILTSNAEIEVVNELKALKFNLDGSLALTINGIIFVKKRDFRLRPVHNRHSVT